mgnify:CR=1 FL=1
MLKPKGNLKENKILTKNQILFLENFIKSDLKEIFRLSGGTALSSFYLKHRFSYDLDFFSEERIPFYIISNFIKSLNFLKDFSHKKHFDRNIFTLNFKDGSKQNVEFVYYPLKNLNKLENVDGLFIDSFKDIMINKACAIADRNEIKDYVDFYFSLKRSNLNLKSIFNLSEKKCGVKGISDILKYKLLKVPEGFESILFIKKIDKKEIEDFFSKKVKKILEFEIK